jgi:hypothetical protein
VLIYTAAAAAVLYRRTTLCILIWQFVYESIASQREASILYTHLFNDTITGT